MIGSSYYVLNSDKQQQMRAMFSVDMVGAGSGEGLILYGATDPSNAWLADLMVAGAADSKLDYDVYYGNTWWASDHDYFDAYTPAASLLALSAGEHGYYHTPLDTIDTINIDDLEASANLLWATLEPLAMGKEHKLGIEVPPLGN